MCERLGPSDGRAVRDHYSDHRRDHHCFGSNGRQAVYALGPSIIIRVSGDESLLLTKFNHENRMMVARWRGARLCESRGVKLAAPRYRSRGLPRGDQSLDRGAQIVPGMRHAMPFLVRKQANPVGPDTFPAIARSRQNQTGQASGVKSGRDRDFQHAVALVREQVIGRFDLVQFEAVRDQRLEVDAARCHDRQ